MTRCTFLVLLALSLTASPGVGQDRARRVILFIGDGTGVSHWTAARLARPDLAVGRFRTMGLVENRSSDSWITDSAAGATAYAAGVRTYNGAIGVGPDSLPRETVLEVARDQGWATGLVATSSITHATPAAFAAHVVSRNWEFDIAADLVESGVDVLLGGGLRWFSPDVRPDGVDLLGQLRESHTVVTTGDELAEVNTGVVDRLAGFFGSNQMSARPWRSPTLPDMTRAALDVLGQNENGFFLMVEGSQPDWRAHDNARLEAVVAEVLDLDEAIGVALDYQSRHPETLIVVTADHETGGLAIEVARDSTVLAAASRQTRSLASELAGIQRLLDAEEQLRVDAALESLDSLATALRSSSRGARTVRLTADYTTTGHTAQMIPLFAKGPGAERFGGILENWRIGELLLEIVRR